MLPEQQRELGTQQPQQSEPRKGDTSAAFFTTASSTPFKEQQGEMATASTDHARTASEDIHRAM